MFYMQNGSYFIEDMLGIMSYMYRNIYIGSQSSRYNQSNNDIIDQGFET